MGKTEKVANGTQKATVFAVTELAWGIVWAAFLQFTRPGKRLANSRTWLSVVIGVGGTLALAKQVLDWEPLLKLTGAFALSSIGIITRSQINEWLEERAHTDGGRGNAKDESAAVGALDRTGWSRQRRDYTRASR